MKCPLCGKETNETIYMNYDRAWVSADPKEGLTIYGPYSSSKGKFCEWKISDYSWGVHLGDTLILREGYDGVLPKERD